MNPPSATTALIKAEEPNPFEQSFSTVTEKFNHFNPPKLLGAHNNSSGPVDVWVSDTSSYSYDSNSVNNDTYSVSDHQGSSEESDYVPHNNKYEMQQPQSHTSKSHLTNYAPQEQYQYGAQFINSHSNGKVTRQSMKSSTKKRSRTTKLPEDEEKRKNFLERNRLAALKCRQRKKQWLNNLQVRVEYLTNDNDHLQMESEALRKEIMDLKTLLVAHKDCPQYINNQSQQQYHHQDFMN
ncbi:unnamed protein product [Mucor hiemalis]